MVAIRLFADYRHYASAQQTNGRSAVDRRRDRGIAGTGRRNSRGSRGAEQRRGKFGEIWLIFLFFLID